MPQQFPPQHGDASRRGLEFIYLTEPGVAAGRGWQLSNVTLDDPDSMLHRTIAQAATQDPLLAVAYNDEPPGARADSSRGHTKGLLVADTKSAFWLVHSVPLYPDFSTGNAFYPPTGTRYAQSFLCISTDTASSLDTIALQLAFNEPHFYRLDIPAELLQRYPNLANLSNRAHVRQRPQQLNRTTTITTRSGRYAFESFAKGRHFDADLYADWLAPQFGSDLLVEAWRHDAGTFPSDCKRCDDRVFNVASINVPALGNFKFSTMNDHAKWAVTAAPTSAPWICVGDLNRAKRQTNRGGGTVCLQHKTVSQQYRALVDAFDPCPLTDSANQCPADNTV